MKNIIMRIRGEAITITIKMIESIEESFSTFELKES